MRWLVLRPVAMTMALLLVSTPVGAQRPEFAVPTDGWRFGAVLLQPEIAITNMGVDTNILRENDGGTRDVVATATTRLGAIVGRGGVRLEGRSGVGVDYFRDRRDLRAVNQDHQVRLLATGRKATLRVDGGWLNARERFNYEVEARVRRTAAQVGAGLDLALTPRSEIAVAAQRAVVDFADDAVVSDVRLRDMLRQRRDRATAGYRYHATPFTTISAMAQADHLRFDGAPARDARRVQVTGGIELAADALVSGHATVGYQWLDPRINVIIPDARGLVASSDVTVRLGERTRLQIAAARDIEYSYQVELPLYTYRTARVGLQQRLGERWRVGGGIGRHVLDYTSAPSRTGLVPSPIDRGWSWSAAIEHRLSRHVHVSLESHEMRRRSADARRQFRAVQVFASVRYALHR